MRAFGKKFFLMGSIFFSLSSPSLGLVPEASSVEEVRALGFDALFDFHPEEEGLGRGEAVKKEATPSQPQGPFYPVHFPDDTDTDLTRLGDGPEALGVKVYVQGTIRDLDGNPIKGAVIEIWQACQSGKYDHPRDDNPALEDLYFQYYAESTTETDGTYSFKTIVPGPYPAHSGWMRPPHIHVIAQAEGYKKVITQIYFAGKSFPEVTSVVRGAQITGAVIDELNALDRHIGRASERVKDELIVEFYPTKDRTGKAIKMGTFDIYLEKN